MTGLGASSPKLGAVTCSGCSYPFTFEREPMTGRVVEICTTCRTRRTVDRQLGLAPDASVSRPRQCARCDAPLPARRGGGRFARYCKNRRECQRTMARREGLEGKASVRSPETSTRRQLLAVVPAEPSRKLSSAQVHALMPAGTKLITVRVALYDLWSVGMLCRERDGAFKYWRAA